MYTGKELNTAIKQVLFVLLIIACIIIGIFELNYFISSILGAFTLYMLLRKSHERLVGKGWKRSFATLFLLTVIVLIFTAIGAFLFGVVYSKFKDFHPQIVVDNVNAIHDYVLEKTGYNIFSKDLVDKTIRSATGFLPGLLSTTGSIMANALMMIFILYFMFQESRRMVSGFENMLPLTPQSISMIKTETHNMVVNNAIGIPLIIIGQALVSGLIYWILNAGDPLIWGIATGIFGLIPIIGTAGIWLPVSVNLFIGGFIWQGITLILYGALVIASVDNLIRIVFMKKYANIHPLITIFGIILGMNLLGFWGIIFGPLMISGFLLLIKIYQIECIKS